MPFLSRVRVLISTGSIYFNGASVDSDLYKYRASYQVQCIKLPDKFLLVQSKHIWLYECVLRGKGTLSFVIISCEDLAHP